MCISLSLPTSYCINRLILKQQHQTSLHNHVKRPRTPLVVDFVVFSMRVHAICMGVFPGMICLISWLRSHQTVLSRANKITQYMVSGQSQHARSQTPDERKKSFGNHSEDRRVRSTRPLCTVTKKDCGQNIRGRLWWSTSRCFLCVYVLYAWVVCRA